jgi:hypothetical protein
MLAEGAHLVAQSFNLGFAGDVSVALRRLYTELVLEFCYRALKILHTCASEQILSYHRHTM